MKTTKKLTLAPKISDVEIEEIEREHIEDYNEFIRDKDIKQITFEQWMELVYDFRTDEVLC